MWCNTIAASGMLLGQTGFHIFDIFAADRQEISSNCSLKNVLVWKGYYNILKCSLYERFNIGSKLIIMTVQRLSLLYYY